MGNQKIEGKEEEKKEYQVGNSADVGEKLGRSVAGGWSGDRLRFQKFFENRAEHEWLSSKEAALYLSVSENALRIMVHRNQIPTFRFGRRLRFRLSDCRALFRKEGA